MSKSLKFDLIAENEEHSFSLVKLCSREEGHDRACEFAIIQTDDRLIGDNLYFYSITISPDTPISIRGKTKKFSESSVSQQHYYFNNRIQHYKFEYVNDCLIIVEHCKTGAIHFHAIVRHTGEIHLHDIEIELKDVFHIKGKNQTINFVKKPCFNIFKTIGYFFKTNVTYAPTRDEDGADTIENYNSRIKSKEYEISKYFLYNIKKTIE